MGSAERETWETEGHLGCFTFLGPHVRAESDENWTERRENKKFDDGT